MTKALLMIIYFFFYDFLLFNKKLEIDSLFILYFVRIINKLVIGSEEIKIFQKAILLK